MFIVGGIGVQAWKLGVDFSISTLFILHRQFEQFPRYISEYEEICK